MTSPVVSIERLVHFNCNCGKWFSIGDAPLPGTYYCPWCGNASRYSLPVAPTEPVKDHEQVFPI